MKKLREAAQELTSYEFSAVPEGWTCHWERYCIKLNKTCISCKTFYSQDFFTFKNFSVILSFQENVIFLFKKFFVGGKRV